MARSAFPKHQLTNLLSSLRDQLELALDCHMMNARKKWGDFYAYARQDPVGQVFIRLFNDIREADPKAWYEEVKKENGPPPPHGDPVIEMAQAFRLMFAVTKDQIDLRYLVSVYFPGDHNEEKLFRLKEKMLFPFLAHVEDLLDFIEEEVPEEEESADLYYLTQDLLRE